MKKSKTRSVIEPVSASPGACDMGIVQLGPTEWKVESRSVLGQVRRCAGFFFAGLLVAGTTTFNLITSPGGPPPSLLCALGQGANDAIGIISIALTLYSLAGLVLCLSAIPGYSIEVQDGKLVKRTQGGESPFEITSVVRIDAGHVAGVGYTELYWPSGSVDLILCGLDRVSVQKISEEIANACCLCPRSRISVPLLFEITSYQRSMQGAASETSRAER